MQSITPQDEHRQIGDAWRLAASDVGGRLAGHAVVFLPADAGGWVDTGIDVAQGQEITLLAHGQVWLSREADLAFGPNVTLWYRIGGGLVARSSANSFTFRAQDFGRLRLIAKPPGEWANRTGDFLSDYPHGGASGGLLTAVLAWAGAADDGLKAFAARDRTGKTAAELERRASERPVPKGWAALWRVGETQMFFEERDDAGQSRITCRCANDAAILTYPVDVPLDETVRLDWSWRVMTLPSLVSENTLGTHDYLSIAVEFDNGQDMTYLWSSSLPVGTAFRCPIPWWDKHETHIVRRTGVGELGAWIDESQPILEDYKTTVGGALPARIVAVWLIALSPFQRRLGECAYRGIRLTGQSASVWIGP
jgi:hypothetical protein